jgi:Pyridoxamine 5'-phosphate oxidase
MKLPESARRLVESDSLAHLVTLDADGSAQVTCIWVGLDGDEIVSAHLGDQRKLRNVARDPRVALSIEGTSSSTGGRGSSKVAHPSCCSGLPTSTLAPRSSSRRWTTRLRVT